MTIVYNERNNDGRLIYLLVSEHDQLARAFMLDLQLKQELDKDGYYPFPIDIKLLKGYERDKELLSKGVIKNKWINKKDILIRMDFQKDTIYKEHDFKTFTDIVIDGLNSIRRKMKESADDKLMNPHRYKIC